MENIITIFGGPAIVIPAVMSFLTAFITLVVAHFMKKGEAKQSYESQIRKEMREDAQNLQERVATLQERNDRLRDRIDEIEQEKDTIQEGKDKIENELYQLRQEKRKLQTEAYFLRLKLETIKNRLQLDGSPEMKKLIDDLLTEIDNQR